MAYDHSTEQVPLILVGKYYAMQLSEISDRAVRRINMNSIEKLFTDNLRGLIRAIESYGYKLRIVGGAVRDTLIGRAPRDLDFITDALPDEIMFILEKHKFPYITKGIPHGTMKVRFSPTEEYEITSLAYEIEDTCCPDKLVVHSSQSWEGDAKRRDFTIDALSISLDGHVYDYTDGLKDLYNHEIKFIGDPVEQIKKDPVLILRFFKLLSLFRAPKFDKGLIPILRDNMNRIKRLKPKRIALEVSNIRKGPNAERVLKMMQSLGVQQYAGDLDALSEHVRRFEIMDAMRFLLEANLLHIVPALRLHLPNVAAQIVVGHQGEVHATIFDSIDPRVADSALKIDSGFFDTNDHRYLSRAEALRMVGAGTSQGLRRMQGSA